IRRTQVQRDRLLRPERRASGCAGPSDGGGVMARRHKDVSVQVEGLDEVQKRLRRLPERAQRHVMRPAVRKAGTVVAKVARRLAPKGDGLKPTGQPRTPLRKTIKSTSVKWYRKTNTFAVVLGPEKNKAPH